MSMSMSMSLSMVIPEAGPAEGENSGPPVDVVVLLGLLCPAVSDPTSPDRIAVSSQP